VTPLPAPHRLGGQDLTLMVVLLLLQGAWLPEIVNRKAVRQA